MQTNNRLFDDLAQLLTHAAGAAKGARDEVVMLMRQGGERLASDLDLAPREEVDVVKAIALGTLERLEAVESRLSAIEGRLDELIAAARS